MQIDVLNARRPTAEYLCSDKMLELSAYLKHALSERGEIRKEACIASFTYVAPSSVKTKERVHRQKAYDETKKNSV